MSLSVPKLGSHVVLVRQEIVNGKRAPVEHDATVIGYERAADHNPEEHGLPNLHLAYLNESRIAELNGANWADAFERVFSVPHEDVNSEGHGYWRQDVEADGLPSAADLDAVAAEDAAKEATAPKSGIRVVKGSKAK